LFFVFGPADCRELFVRIGSGPVPVTPYLSSDVAGATIRTWGERLVFAQPLAQMKTDKAFLIAKPI